jgi:Mce-associated membrane protein
MSAGIEPVEVVTTTEGADNRRTLVAGSLVLAVVMLLALAVVSQLVSSQNSQNRHDRAVAASTYLLGPAARAAAAAAETEVKATLTYNYQTLQADFAAAERGLTARFKPSYQQTTSTSVAPLATKYHATSTASVRPAGVSQAGPSVVKVLLFVDQTVTNTQLAHPRLDRSRITVTMKQVNGHWLVDNLQPL